jgi:uncharacterized protein with PIN domain
MTGKVWSRQGAEVEALHSSWWADEMLGRLARYLRIVGLDTAYVRGVDDDEVLRRSIAEGRVLITRDRALARRSPGSVLLTTVHIEDQWRELKMHLPALPNEPRFERCTLCNGILLRLPTTDRPARDATVPERVWESGQPLFRREACRHVYWEGSHALSVRRRLVGWSGESSP